MKLDANIIFYRAMLFIGAITILAAVALSGTVTAQATGSIQVTVENEIGEPIPEADINVTTTNNVNKTTNSDGTRKITGINVGLAEVSVDHPDYEKKIKTDLPISTDSTTTTAFVLERTTSTITGRVRLEDPDQRGNPPLHTETDERVTVRVKNHPEQDLIEKSNNLQVETQTNDTSFYTLEIPTVDGEKVSAVAELDGYDNTIASNITNNPIIVASISEGTITGSITTRSGGAAVEGATVRVADIAPEDYTGIDNKGEIRNTTNDSGVYVIDDVPAGNRDIVVTADTFLQEERDVTIEDDATTNESIQLTHRRLRINSVTPQTGQSGDTVTVTYTYTGVFETLTLTVGDQIETSVDVDPAEETGEVTFDIPDRGEITDGTYTIKLGTPRRTATAEITVENPVNPEGTGSIGPPVRSPAGDFVSIPTGGEYMIIGGDKRGGERTQFLDVLHVSGGSAVLNTRLVGTNVSSSRAYGEGVTSYAHSIGADAGPKKRAGTVFEDVSFRGATSLSEFREKLSIDTRSVPLQVGRYQLVAGENGRIVTRSGGPDFAKPVGRSNLILTQTQQLGEINTYIAPPASADETSGQIPGEAVEAETVAVGERLFIEVPATGMWGATLPDADSELTTDQLATLLNRQEGVRIEFDTSRVSGPNVGGGTLEFQSVASSDLSVSLDTAGDLISNETVTGDQPIISGYYLVVDTRGADPFGGQPDPGSVLKFEMAYESPLGESYRFDSNNDGQPNPFDPAVSPQDGIEHFPYFGDDDTTVERNTTIRFIEPSITYARTRPDGSLIIPAEDDGQIFGSTTMVPGSQMTIRLIGGDGPNPELIETIDTTVEDDRTFSASADFSKLSPGQRVEVEFASQNRLEDNRVIDKRSAYVVDNFDNPARFQISSFAGDIQVQQRDALDELQATITNNGSIAGRQLVEFRIAGEPIRNETITIGSGGSETLDLSGQFVTLPTGTYQYTVATDDDQRTGQLTVGAPDTGTVITDTASQGATTSGQIGGGETTGGTDDGGDSGEPSGLFSLVGVRTRDVAVATAIAGATHILGYWT